MFDSSFRCAEVAARKSEIKALQNQIRLVEETILQKVEELSALKNLLEKKQREGAGEGKQDEEYGDRFWSQFQYPRRSQRTLRIEESGVSSIMCPPHEIMLEEVDI